jgi:hypothetical protein
MDGSLSDDTGQFPHHLWGNHLFLLVPGRRKRPQILFAGVSCSEGKTAYMRHSTGWKRPPPFARQGRPWPIFGSPFFSPQNTAVNTFGARQGKLWAFLKSVFDPPVKQGGAG